MTPPPTRATIVEITAEYGFCDQSTFTRRFRRIPGTTPVLYRSGYHSGSQWGV
jgi:AraC-like DNA-binding protein